MIRSIRSWLQRRLAQLSANPVPEISPDELQRWLADGQLVQLVDARSAIEFGRGSLPGAQHAPLGGMPQSLEELELDYGKPVVFLCLSGHRSRPGTRRLRARGVEAYSLKGGLMAWWQKGYPFAGDPARAAEE